MSDGEHLEKEHQSLWRCAHRIVVTIQPWGILLAVVALVPSVIQFGLEYEDRLNDRTVRAWQLVTTAGAIPESW